MHTNAPVRVHVRVTFVFKVPVQSGAIDRRTVGW